MKYYFFPFKSKSIQMLRPQKENSGISFDDTHLNFGLNWFKNIPCLKFWAQIPFEP